MPHSTKEKDRAWRKPYYQAHRAERLEYLRQYRQSPGYKECRNEYQRQRRAEDKASVLAYYGGRCSCCGETNTIFLTVDHVDGGGTLHRKKLNNQGMWTWLRRKGFPNGFQILCMNCNFGKYQNGGVCPHKDNSSESVK